MVSLNVIGAGRVGRTLARLWHDSQVFQVQGVCARDDARAQDAVAFIGAGQARADITPLPAADVWMVTTPDTVIADTANTLSSALREGDIMFHCSGTLPSGVLAAARERGAQIGRAHV